MRTVLDPRPPLLEGTRPLVPERRELEAGRRLAALLQRPHSGDPRDAVDAHADRPPRDEVPGTALQDEPERIDRPLDGPRPLPVAKPHAPAMPNRLGDRREVLDAAAGAGPTPGAEVE